MTLWCLLSQSVNQKNGLNRRHALAVPNTMVIITTLSDHDVGHLSIKVSPSSVSWSWTEAAATARLSRSSSSAEAYRCSGHYDDDHLDDGGAFDVEDLWDIGDNLIADTDRTHGSNLREL